jgi:flagellin
MALVINNNISSLNAQRNLSTTQMQLTKSMERLSSGQRINRAGDDAAGLAISENMRATVRGMNQAVRNANDGVSMLQTAEGALNETSNILIRMRELAEQSANGTVGDEQRKYIQNEFVDLQKEIDRIADVTEFNGTKLLDGSLAVAGVNFQVSTKAVADTDYFNTKIDAASTAALGVWGETCPIPPHDHAHGTNVMTEDAARNALGNIDGAINTVAEMRGKLGSTQNRLTSTITNLQVSIENTSAAESRIRDVDVAAETSSMTRAQILTQAGTAILAQANQAPQAALSLLR